MSWKQKHSEAMQVAEAAHNALRAGEQASARKLFAQAAMLEEAALANLSPDQPRTSGITAISAASLWLKSQFLSEAERVSSHLLSVAHLPDFAKKELRTILQTVWYRQAQAETDLRFAPGQVHVSVKGGEVVTGGAPANIILSRIQTIENIYYRTAEFSDGQPLRRRGLPSKRIQDMCRPWLFQSPPGSFQFMVAVQEVAQASLFPEDMLDARCLTEKFLSIVRATVEDPENDLPQLVADPGYRRAFLGLSRNLAPNGKAFSSIEIRTLDDPKPVTLIPETRALISKAIKVQTTGSSVDILGAEPKVLGGVLRALNLDKDWLELTVDNNNIRVHGLGEEMDDVIGPMVNHTVRVKTAIKNKRHYFVDMESEE
jgi:hypothetical protein